MTELLEPATWHKSQRRNLRLLRPPVFDTANCCGFFCAKNHSTTDSVPRWCVASCHPFFLPRNGCDVTKIRLPGRPLHGSLAKEFGELRALDGLNLEHTNVTGNLDVLKENTALTYLNLRNTRISGDLQSLAKATKLVHLYLRGTLLSGDVVALSNAKDLRGMRIK